LCFLTEFTSLLANSRKQAESAFEEYYLPFPHVPVPVTYVFLRCVDYQKMQKKMRKLPSIQPPIVWCIILPILCQNTQILGNCNIRKDASHAHLLRLCALLEGKSKVSAVLEAMRAYAGVEVPVHSFLT